MCRPAGTADKPLIVMAQIGIDFLTSWVAKWSNRNGAALWLDGQSGSTSARNPRPRSGTGQDPEITQSITC